MSARRVLLTGGTGFIGQHVVAPLRARGYEVHVVTSSAGRVAPAGVRTHVADLLDPAATEALVDEIRATHLVHLAWYVSPGRFWTAAENGEWVEATLRLLRLFGAAGGERAVLAGSCAEYDWTVGGVCSEQSTPLVPATLYGACKAALGSMAARLAGETGVSTAWGRIFFVYGPDEYPSRLLASVVRALLAGERAPTSHGGQIRDYLSTMDYGDAFAAVLDSDVRGAVNIASGVPLALRDLVMRAAQTIGRPELVDLGAIASPPDEAPVVVADVTRLRDEVGWMPRLSLDEGLERTIAWWRESRRFEHATR